MNNQMDGQIFGRWTVVSFAFARPPHRYYNCRCVCGVERAVQGPSLVSGVSRSCGCLRREVSRNIRVKHDSCGHPAYQSWTAMRRRCQDKNMTAYSNYGGRGISVCAEWQTFEGFWEDMGALWRQGLTIERNDNDGNYEPGNCRWATYKEQSHNKRNTVLVDTPWGLLAQSEAARRGGISLGALIHRMKTGWPKELWFSPSIRATKQPDR